MSESSNSEIDRNAAACLSETEFPDGKELGKMVADTVEVIEKRVGRRILSISVPLGQSFVNASFQNDCDF